MSESESKRAENRNVPDILAFICLCKTLICTLILCTTLIMVNENLTKTFRNENKSNCLSKRKQKKCFFFVNKTELDGGRRRDEHL